MNTALPAATPVFTPGERDYIRRELDQFFSTLPRVADGVQLRTWRGGPQAGQPKVPAIAQGLLERGLMRLEPTPWPPRLVFTDAGLLALRAMMSDGRLANPRTFAHVRRELGIDPDPASDRGSTAGTPDVGQAAQGSGAAAFPSPLGWGNSPGPTERNAPMAHSPKTDTPPAPARRGRKPKAAAASPAVAPAVEDDDTALAPAESSTPPRDWRGRTPGPQVDAMAPALPLAAGLEPAAAEASPPADGPKPAENDGDAMIAERAVPVTGKAGDGTGPKEHGQAAPQGGDVVSPSLPSNSSAPATPAARWDRASDRVSFDWPATERTAAQHGPNQAIAKLLLAARAEGAQSRWPL